MQKPLTEHLPGMRYTLLLPLASLLLGSLPALGQLQPEPLATDNSAWIDSVQHLSLPQQVAAVRVRAWHDTLRAPYQPPVCRLVVPTATAPQHPLLPTLPGFPLVYIVEETPFYNNDAATVNLLQRILTERPIRQVTLLHAAAATALYGARGANGVVVLSSKKARR